MGDEKSLRFYPRAKIIFIVGILVTLSQLVYWQANRHWSLNLLIVGSGLVTGFLVFYMFLKRVNVAKYALYIFTLLIIFACIALFQSSLARQISLLAHLITYLGTLLVLGVYRTEAREYFRTTGLGTGWKVAYGIVFVLISAGAMAALAYQKHLNSQSKAIAGDLQSTLIMEGDAPPAAIAACKEKYASVTTDLNDEQLNRFCTCVALNLQAMLDGAQGESPDMTGLLSRYMAIGDACMARIRD